MVPATLGSLDAAATAATARERDAGADLASAVRAFSRPWRSRRRRELSIALLFCACLFAALALGLGAVAAVASIALPLLASVAIALVRRRERQRAGRVWEDVEAYLRTGGALRAAFEGAAGEGLARLACRRFARSLRSSVPPRALAVRSPLWIALSLAVGALTAAFGLALEVRDRERAAHPSRASAFALDFEAEAEAERAERGLAEDGREEIAREVRALRASRERREISESAYAARLEHLAQSYAAPRATSTMARPSSAESPQAVRGAGALGSASRGDVSAGAGDAAGAGANRGGASGWFELPERYRLRVARYFELRRRD